jgi:hypothetical protein
MTIGGGIFLIAVGAILKYATSFQIDGINIHIIGLILMIAGLAGVLIGAWQWAVWSRRPGTRREAVVEDRVGERRRYPEPPPDA